VKLYKIDFEPIGRRGECPAGQSLLEAAQGLGVDLVSLCGGKGTCHRCKVQVLDGSVSPPTESEESSLSPQELAEGYRLACQIYPLSDCKLRVPPESLTTPQRTQVEGLEVAVSPEPPVRAYYIELPPPSMEDLRADAKRVLETLYQQHQVHCSTIDLETLRALSPQLRSGNWQAQASVRGDEVVAVSSWPSRQLGLAVDVGTTKIAGYLLDLESGQTLAARGIMNPQIAFGEDVIARITHVSKSASAGAQLQMLVVEALNKLFADLCAEIGAEHEEILEVVVVGNTAMHHLLLRLPVAQLAISPFLPAVSEALDVKARDIELCIAPGAYVHLLPNIAGFVGADHVAMLLATGVCQTGGVTLALDIGTNTEVALVRDGEIASVSCASGPAFEGAHIKYGMRAAPGAIERLRLVGDTIEYQTIGGTAPVGLCGSGILDAIAHLHLAGALDAGGRMADHPRVRTVEGQREFVLVSEEERESWGEQGEQKGRPAITITQRDVRELQLAKGAIYGGIQVLLESTGHAAPDIAQVIIAGAFGSYIDIESAITIGMLPPLPLGRFRQVGNAAGMGAKLALISQHQRVEAQRIASRARYIELTTAPDFTQTFIDSTYIGYKQNT
jgi:uncharacterized 2Fe-2S/4Fe-4S cluster protein (DUF4445 family)